MSGWSLFFVTVGVGYLTSRFFRLLKWIDGE